ncbi:MAG: hypothetical protein H0U59_13460 [Gemmatimonadaceae bacterium]|nr:hypothetical protein [Gemmatimonadaceae bacterium]
MSIAAGGVASVNQGFFQSSGNFSNAGYFQILSNAGASFGGVGTTFSNTGTLDVAGSGSTTINSAVTQHSGSTLTAGTWNVFGGASLSITTGATILTNQANILLHGTGSFNAVDSLQNNDGNLTISDGKTLTLAGSLSNSASLTVGPDSRLDIGGGLTNTGTLTGTSISPVTTNPGNAPTLNCGGDLVQSGTFVFDGTVTANGSATFSGTHTWAPGAVFNAGSGTTAFASSAGANLTVNASAGTVQFASAQTLGGFNLSGTAAAVMAANGNQFLHVYGLTIGANAGLNLNDNDLIVEYGTNPSAYGDVRALVLGGFGGTTGINSGTSNGTQILALFDNALLGATEWLGEPVGVNSVIGKYTYMGDVNLDGQVTGDDYTVIDSNLDTTPVVGMEWLSGDSNLDGSVTGDDYTVIDSNLGSGDGNPLSPASTFSNTTIGQEREEDSASLAVEMGL